MDTTTERLVEYFSKCGLIRRDQLTDEPCAKIYTDSVTGAPKGEGLVSFEKEESVDLAIELLDGDQNMAPGHTLRVTHAEFTQKGDKFVPKQRCVRTRAMHAKGHVLRITVYVDALVQGEATEEDASDCPEEEGASVEAQLERWRWRRRRHADCCPQARFIQMTHEQHTILRGGTSDHTVAFVLAVRRLAFSLSKAHLHRHWVDTDDVSRLQLHEEIEETMGKTGGGENHCL